MLREIAGRLISRFLDLVLPASWRQPLEAPGGRGSKPLAGPEAETAAAEPAGPGSVATANFSREQREAHSHGAKGDRGNHGGPPAEAGRFHKDRDARPHK